MIRALGNKKIDLNNEEYLYYKELKSSIGESEFLGLFSTDENGIVMGITPSSGKTTSILAIFFLLNVMMNQRLRMLDDRIGEIDNLNNRVSSLEKIIDNISLK
tara:strand:+ start:215 stop:523 length:309 start_codon:yes stop_codon:yes gene_type:complete